MPLPKRERWDDCEHLVRCMNHFAYHHISVSYILAHAVGLRGDSRCIEQLSPEATSLLRDCIEPTGLNERKAVELSEDMAELDGEVCAKGFRLIGERLGL